jgi:16S rRNA (guanine966-N2)-methyltransferase
MIAPWLHTMPSSSSRQRKSRSLSGKHVSANTSQLGVIRIISGKHRGRKLPVLSSEGLRPTASRVKETLFNWLMQDIVDAHVLDMFAGAGSLGFEAYSRMAKQVVMLESNIKAARQLELNITTLDAGESVSVLCEDALSALPRVREHFDIVFIDPPFFKGLVNPSISALIELQKLQQHALIYAESEASLPAFEHPHLRKIKEQSTQQVCYRLYTFSETEAF